jgi:hypothetical protein
MYAFARRGVGEFSHLGIAGVAPECSLGGCPILYSLAVNFNYSCNAATLGSILCTATEKARAESVRRDARASLN